MSRLSRWATALVIMLAIAGAWGWNRYQSHRTRADAAELTAAQVQKLRAQLSGDWVAKDVSSAIGPLKVEMVLRENGSCHVNLWTSGPIVAQLRNNEGSYELKGDRIFSELLKRGSCKYWFNGPRLMVEYKGGTILGFERAGTRVAQASLSAVDGSRQ